jgi:hypothetical protein
MSGTALPGEQELHHYYDVVKASIVGKTLSISSNTCSWSKRSTYIGNGQDILPHFVRGVVCRVSWQATLAMAAQVNSSDCKVVSEASDIARFMPLLAHAASAMQQHDRWPCATTIICNPGAIWRVCE